jgi:hypothetical protein
MEHGRTGTRYRLLLATAGQGRFVNAFINLFIALMAAFALLGCGLAATRSLREATAPSSVLRRLLRDPTEVDLAGGRTWGAATLRTSDAGAVCLVEHQHYVSGKNGGWRTDSWSWIGADPMLELGRSTFRLNLQAVEFDPRDPDVVADESAHRARINFVPGGRLREQCLHDGATAFADLCVTPGAHTTGRCSDDSTSTLTLGQGSPAARIRQHANSAAAGLTAALLAAALLAAYVWRAVRRGAIVEALGAWSRAPTPGSRAPVWLGIAAVEVLVLVAAIALATTRSVIPHYVSGYVFASVVLGVVAVGLVVAHDRRRTVERAIEPVVAAETARLAQVGEGMAELEVRVRADAPTVTFEGLPPCAFLRVNVQRVVAVGRSVQLVPLHTASWPATVPVEDPSGGGLLDPQGASFDLRARFFHVSGADAIALLHRLAETPFGRTGAEQSAVVSLEVEVSYLEPGERLYLLGHIHRVEDPSASTTYRAMGTLPVIAATGEAQLAVHAGREATLLRGLTAERVYLQAATAALVGLSGGLVTALAWLATRA